MTMASQFANIMSSSNVFDGGFVSLVKFTGLVTLTVIFSFIRANQKSGNRKTYVWVLPNIWRVEKVSDTKFGANGSKNPKKGLLNAGKCQGYSFYRFWVIMGKPIKWGVGEVILPLLLPRLGLIEHYLYSSCCFYSFGWLVDRLAN